MKRLLLISATAMVLTLPAAAQQSSSSPSSTSNPSAASSSNAPSATQSSQQTKADQRKQIVSAQEVQQNLQKAGFKSVEVVDAAYLIHANTKNGDFVLMLIDPPGSPLAAASSSNSNSTSATSSHSVQAQSSAQRHSAQQTLKSNLEKAGYENVAIVDAAFLVHAKTPDGSNVRMTINPPAMGSATETTGSASSGSPSSTNPSSTVTSPPQR